MVAAPAQLAAPPPTLASATTNRHRHAPLGHILRVSCPVKPSITCDVKSYRGAMSHSATQARATIPQENLSPPGQGLSRAGPTIASQRGMLWRSIRHHQFDHAIAIAACRLNATGGYPAP